MQFQIKMPEKSRNDIARDKQATNKVPVMFFDQ